MLVAFTTTSSAATLPVSIKLAEERLGCSKKVYGFTLPLGNTVFIFLHKFLQRNICFLLQHDFQLPRWPYTATSVIVVLSLKRLMSE